MTYHPHPSPIIGGVREREQRQPKRIRRVAYYGPMAITYDCDDHPTDGEANRDVLNIAFTPNDWSDGWPKVKNPNDLLTQTLGAIQIALNITTDELIENAPSRTEDA